MLHAIKITRRNGRLEMNFIYGLLKAPAEPVKAPVFVATYSNGFGFERKEITAPNRFSAYAKAKVYMPDGCTLTHLRQKKGRK